MRRIGGFILTAIGIFIVFLAVKALFSIPENTEVINSAITVQDGKINPANEGKLVVVSGTLESDEVLQDPLTGVKLPGIVAKRVVWIYGERSLKNDEILWDWMEQYIDFTDESNHGINAKSQVSTMLATPTTIGEFNVENSFLSEISLFDDFTEYDEKSLNEGWYIHSNDKESKYSISKEEKLAKKEKLPKYVKSYAAGMQKISYRIISPKNPLEYTLIGIQKGDTLIKTTDAVSKSICEGILTAEEFAKETGNSVRGGSIFALVIGIVVTAVGLKISLFGGYME